MAPEEARTLSEEALADLFSLISAERVRRARLGSAANEIRDILARVDADGGDRDAVIMESQTAE